MASLGRISNSLVSAVNENTLALASLNFDFSLVKLQAPEEYTTVGHCLAPRRRDNAESGMAHRTARKLGALFESIIPSMPRLIAAYGKRVTEILETPDVNPSGDQERHGPFTAFVGADATSIWAAATSGTASIAVHLLACLIARAFRDPAEAASVWVEIVIERQKEIEQAAQNGLSSVTQLGMINAASQQFPREELRQWDANARAWIQSSDAAMRKQHIQLRLILKNVNLPVSVGARLYSDVIRAWTQAMNGVERLLGGEPQSVTDGAILLAISAWHLYPNLLVLGGQTTKVDFSDPVMKPSGVLTIGITNKDTVTAGNEGIYWSLALSHYRYYGKPVKACGEVDDRLSIEELQMATLGCLMRSWEAPRDSALLTAEWLISLWCCVDNAKSTLPGPEWLEFLVEAADRLLKADEKKAHLSLIDFGYRRGRKFLVNQGAEHSCLPWFGLRSPHILKSLTQETTEECGFQYLREVASAGGLRRDEALISSIFTGKRTEHHQYTTAVATLVVPYQHQDTTLENEAPILDDDAKEDGDGDSDDDEMGHNYKKDGSRHVRWVGTFYTPSTQSEVFEQELAEYQNDPTRGLPRRHDHNIDDSPQFSFTKTKKKLDRKLLCESITINPNLVFADCQAQLPCSLSIFPTSSTKFAKVFGDTHGGLQLWVTDLGSSRVKDIDDSVCHMQAGSSQPLVGMPEAIATLKDSRMNRVLLWQYLEGINPHEHTTLVKSILDLMREERERCDIIINSLRSLAVAKRIYTELEGATVSASIIERGISDAKWGVAGRSTFLNRSMVFSCIAMMETGEIDLEAKSLEHVIALSSGNSLFVLSRILADPFAERPEYSVTRIIGNVGRAGISLLVPPAAGPLTRSLSSSVRAVSYAAFDGRHVDKFGGTSLHLSFTMHEFPVDYGTAGIIDHQVFFVESVVSVHDSGKWVADLDVLRLYRGDITRIKAPQRRNGQPCCHSSEMVTEALRKFVAVDSWEEVLDTTPGVGLVRSHKNWAARLAAATILSQDSNSETDSEEEESESEDRLSVSRKFAVLQNKDDVCWVCVDRHLMRDAKMEPGFPFYLVA
ncbi:hypothetical protein F4821DRAFT_214564 [Hypoxylon rubiginosum]|uniref:Uncharacterized protein n=1 Tax=Hypoxylon rubiginosum TaxID=110542 RepID=A0ACC0CQ18_9PEZI|nr:hypothetical protein F4821DRAFT_214564 [Hypoxylon rubiginosum]